MGLLDKLEGIFVPSRRPKQIQVDLKEIYCKRKDDDYIKRFRTAAVGTAYRNPDGSDRQTALKKLKQGAKVRLIWDAGASGNKNTVYLVCSGRARRELSLPDCFGRLNDKVAADVIRWMTKEGVITAAKVADITGGTPKHPNLGCVLELTTYPAPPKKD
ncbi:hypothetical protein ACFL5W_01310 [Thermodesulfobacteriota bacterium]